MRNLLDRVCLAKSGTDLYHRYAPNASGRKWISCLNPLSDPFFFAGRPGSSNPGLWTKQELLLPEFRIFIL